MQTHKKNDMRRTGLLALLTLVLLGLNLTPARAANFSAGDAASLIAAINTANSNGEDDVITLSSDIVLTAVDNSQNGLPITLADSGHSLTIEGGGYKISRAAAAPDFRIFQVASGAKLALNHLTLTNGSVTGVGGALYNNGGAVIITNSTLSGNSATDGGAIWHNGVLNIFASTFSNNTANSGGGILSIGAVTLINNTLSGNSAAHGSGIYTLSTLTSINTTLANNTGVALVNDSGNLRLRNSILADTQGGSNCSNLGGTIDTNINTLIEGGGCGNPAFTADPNLGPLADNGGPTQTHALLAGSPAIEVGDDASCPATDQRGVARPQDARCDIGAFEVDATPPVITPHVSGALGNNGWYTGDVSLSWSVSDASTISSTGGCEPTTLTSDTAGITFTCEATSEGGSNSASLTIQRDATPPVVSITGVTDGAIYEEGAVPTAGCETQAGLAGIATLASLSLSGGDSQGLGAFTATCAGATDNAGNIATPVSISYSVTAAEPEEVIIFLPLIN